MSFDRYIALGDGISIDLHPARDEAERGDPASQAPPRTGLGAASLLHRNDDRRWPEFAGRDLERLADGIAFRNAHRYHAPAGHPTDNYATDGATTVGVLAYQLGRVEPSEERTLITLTAGASDVRQMIGAPRPPAAMVDGMLSRMERLVRTVRAKRPHALLLVATIFDPTDGTRRLDSGARLDRESDWIADFNAGVRALVARSESTALADLHRHFLGHGVTAPVAERWYWRGALFEPGARGASEVRRVWLDALDARGEPGAGPALAHPA